MSEEIIRILVIPSSDYLGHPFPQRHNHLFERIHDEKEFEVHILRFDLFGRSKLASKCIIHEIPLEIKIRNTGLYYLSNVINYVSEIQRIIKRESIDIVFAGNLLPPLTYVLLRKLMERKIPFIFDLQDYYPTSATGYLADVKSILGIYLKGFFETMTRYLIRNADVVTVPGVALAMYAKDIGAKRVYILPNGISEHFLKRYDGEKIRRKLGYDDNDMIVGYVGSIEFWLDMKTLIKAVSIAKMNRLPIKLLLIGRHLQTDYSLKVKRWLEEYDVKDIATWLDFVSHEEVPEYIAAIDVATIPFDTENPTAYYAAPNKLWEYLSQGASVASTPIPEALAYRFIRKLFIVKTSEEYVKVFEKIFKSKDKFLDPYIEQILQKRLWKHSADMLREIFRTLKSAKQHY